MTKSVSYIIKENGTIKDKEFEYVDDCTVGLTTDMFLTSDEIVYDIVTNRLSEDDKKYFRNISEGDLSMEHLGFGMWIRNTYGLWELLTNSLVEEMSEPDSIKHPDNLSFKVMELVVKTLNGEYTPDVTLTEKDFDEAMKIMGGE